VTNISLSILYVMGNIVLYSGYVLGYDNFAIFTVLFALTFAIAPPAYAISPSAILFIYYGAWFVCAPMFADRYRGGVLSLPEYRLSIAFAYSVFGLGAIAIRLGERLGAVPGAIALARCGDDELQGALRRVFRAIIVLTVASTVFLALIVYGSGGIQRWLDAPGDAFLERQGTGIYVVGSHFCSQALVALVGYYAFMTGRMASPALISLWIAVTSPVHGSKLQISLLFILLFTPWLRRVRLMSVSSMLIFACLGAVVLFGLYLRNLSWIDASTIIPYTLNYFTALENLAISVRDFKPDFLTTFFMPFMKFTTPFGLSNLNLYFDMNHMLTDVYYPHAWEIRATEQWPVETDLYLNFYFFGGLILVAFYLFMQGFLYSRARVTNTLGAWFVTIMMTLSILSHMRGSLINHIDFYMYPYIIAMYFILRRLPLGPRAP
jgi:hypothetical protein